MTDIRLAGMILLGALILEYSYARVRPQVDTSFASMADFEQVAGGASGSGGAGGVAGSAGGGMAGISGGAGTAGTAGGAGVGIH